MRSKKLVQLSARNFMQENGSCYPVNLQHIAQQGDIQICYIDNMPNNVNGVTIPLQDGSYIIAIRSRQPLLNERFSLAREIAHIVLGHSAEGIIITSTQDIFPGDWESHAFALEMLVPLEELKYILSTNEVPDIDKLCTLFGVSGEIIIERLNEIGLIQFNPTMPYTLSLVSCGT